MAQRLTLRISEPRPVGVPTRLRATGDRRRLYCVVASHCIGGVAGLLAYILLGAGTTLTAPPPGSAAGLHLSGVVLVVAHGAVVTGFDRVVGQTHPRYAD